MLLLILIVHSVLLLCLLLDLVVLKLLKVRQLVLVEGLCLTDVRQWALLNQVVVDDLALDHV